jgi:hypothetical protein
MPMHKKHWITCPDCATRLPRMSAAIQSHYRDAHNKMLTEADAYKIVSPQPRRKTPYAEGLRKNFEEVPGGLPTLGKRR